MLRAGALPGRYRVLLLPMNQATRPHPDWKAPKGDGEILIWPEPARLLQQTLENHKRLSAVDHVRIQGVPLCELRRRQRVLVRETDHEPPLIATGHQVELYHPGVWAKNVLIDAVARRLRGTAHHVAVDTDAPKHLVLRLGDTSYPITDDPRLTAAAWTCLLDAPRHLERLAAAVRQAAAGWGFEPVLLGMVDRWRGAPATEGLARFVAWSASGCDDSVMSYQMVMASQLWGHMPYLVLVHHVLARADEFASRYNTALGDYRRAEAIRSPGRPWPDLRNEADACEAPFWLDWVTEGRRERPVLRRVPGGWSLVLSNGQRFCFDPGRSGWAAAAELDAFLGGSQVRLAPRALMLTLFMRLFLADQFVHGIGGGRYDQVTDAMIRSFLGLEPPAFCVTTATLHFPGAAAVRRVDLPAMYREGRRIRHSLPDGRKMEFVRQIEAAPRRSAQRRRAFHAMHEALATANRQAILAWEQRLAEARSLAEKEKFLFDRELFFAIQTRQRLLELIDKYRQALDNC